MGQDKKLLESLLSLVERIYANPDNNEFIEGIRNLVKEDPDCGFNDSRIDEIYEMCIRKILKEQAESAYEGFPIPEIKGELVADYIKMERAHRENNIDEFGIRLYRQIECITKSLSKDEVLSRVVAQMMDVPYLVDSNDVSKRIKQNKKGDAIKPIYEFVLIDSKRKNITKAEKKSLPLSEQYATDMLHLILYFVCFRGMLQSGRTYDQWNDQKKICSEIYSIRNRVHGGGECSEYDVRIYEETRKNKAQSFHRLLSFLFFFIAGVKQGFPVSERLIEFADSQ